jgi:hypothetical protein
MKYLTRIPLTVLLLICGLTATGQDITELTLLRKRVSEFGQAEVTVSYKGHEQASALSREFSVDRYRDGKLHIVLSHTTVERFINLQLPFGLADPPDSKGLVTAESATMATDWQSYPTYSQYVLIMRQFAIDHPALCRLDTIGTSINGKLVLVLKISDNVAFDEPDEPEVFYSSTMHGDELAGFVLMMRLADHLLENYATDTRVRTLVDNLQIYINPLANPDGTYRTGDEIASPPTRFNANGRDLNRNFPDPLQPTVVQEKENVDMIAFMKSRRFVLSANFHAGEEVVNYPWDRWLTKSHADNEWFKGICRAYADTVHLYSPAGYMDGFDNGIVRGAVWYVINGGRQDYMTWERQGREVTIELDNVKQTPALELEAKWQSNYRSLLNYLYYALHGIRGRVTCAETGHPVGAKIFITGHDADSSHIYADTVSGYYNRLLLGGTWGLQFSAPGYRDTIITNLVLIPGEPLLLDVVMEPLLLNDDTVNTDSVVLFPNPSAGSFSLGLSPRFAGEVSIKVYSHSGLCMYSKIAEHVPDNLTTIDLSAYPQGVYTVVVRHIASGIFGVTRAIIIR